MTGELINFDRRRRNPVASTVTLANGVELNAQSPETFWVPSADIKSALRTGDFVKLVFIGAKDEMPERMWVIVTAIDGDKFTGTLDNQPFTLTGISYGDRVEFGAENIIDVHGGDAQ